MGRPLFLAVALPLAALAVALASAPARGLPREHSDHGMSVRWPTAGLRWWAAAGVDRAVVQRAVAAWMDPPCSGLDLAEAPIGARAAITVVVAPRPWRHAAADGAWTELDSDPDSGVLRRAAISLSPDHWPDLADDARAALLVHEFGHALGFGHTLQRDSVMHPSVGARASLHGRDALAVCSLYPKAAPPALARRDPPALVAAVAVAAAALTVAAARRRPARSRH